MATPQTRTLNQIVTEFQQIAEQHRMISSFACGTMDDFAASGTTYYPALFVDYSAINFPSIKEQSFVFDFFCVDRVKKDRSNLQEVLSDRAIVVGHIKSQILSPDYGWRGDVGDSDILFEEFHEDEVAGWKFTVTITQPFTNDICVIPFIVPPTPTTGYSPSSGSYNSVFVPTSRRITINGTTYDLTADREWTISVGGSQTLAQTLGYGNQTGSNDIYVKDGQSIWSENEEAGITFDDSNGILIWSGVARFSSIAALTSRIAYFDTNGNLQSLDTATYPSLIELSYLKGASSSIQTQLNGKESTITAGTTAQYWRGDKTFQTLNTTAVNEGTNLYFTNSRADARISNAIGVTVQSYSSSTTLLGNSTTGSGNIVLSTSPSLTTPNIGTPSGGVLTNCTGLPIAGGGTGASTAVGARSNLGAPFVMFGNLMTSFSPADGTTYYSGLAGLAPTTTATNQDYNLGYAFTIIGAMIVVGSNTVAGSNENITWQIRNTTQSTSSSIGTFTSDGGSSTLSQSFSFTGLNISVAAGDLITMQFDSPTWATNPTTTNWRTYLICIRA